MRTGKGRGQTRAPSWNAFAETGARRRPVREGCEFSRTGDTRSPHSGRGPCGPSATGAHRCRSRSGVQHADAPRSTGCHPVDGGEAWTVGARRSPPRTPSHHARRGRTGAGLPRTAGALGSWRPRARQVCCGVGDPAHGGSASESASSRRPERASPHPAGARRSRSSRAPRPAWSKPGDGGSPRPGKHGQGTWEPFLLAPPPHHQEPPNRFPPTRAVSARRSRLPPSVPAPRGSLPAVPPGPCRPAWPPPPRRGRRGGLR